MSIVLINSMMIALTEVKLHLQIRSIAVDSTNGVIGCRKNVQGYIVTFCSRFPLPLSAWDGLRYFIVALPEHSI